MNDQLVRSNVKFARSRWKCDLNRFALQLLKALTNQYQFSIAEGDLIWLERRWYVTHAGLVRLASRNRCAGIHSKPVPELFGYGSMSHVRQNASISSGRPREIRM
jgi:hypothetical protein